MRTASKRNSVLLERIASYRAPLIPHLARHSSLYATLIVIAMVNLVSYEMIAHACCVLFLSAN